MIFPEEPEPLSLPMSKERLGWNLECIGWGPAELARRLDVDERNVSRWLQGKKELPDRVAVWIETLRGIIMALPTPTLWPDTADLIDIRHDTLKRSTAFMR